VGQSDEPVFFDGEFMAEVFHPGQGWLKWKMLIMKGGDVFAGGCLTEK